MKILLTGGGTGGHFYPIIAVAEYLNSIAEKERLIEPKLYYMADAPYDENLLFENNIKFVKVSAGKMRRYFSIKNFSDTIKTFVGIIQAIFKMFFIFPDVVFSKGGYVSFPALFAARILGIPVVIHESDSVPGRVNLWSGRFARRIALSYPEALNYFSKERCAVTGNPIRKEILAPISIGAHEFLDLDPNLPVVFIVGGSQGAVKINDTVMEILPKLLEKYQVIHQVGSANIEECASRAKIILGEGPLAARYKIFDFLNETALRMTAGVASLIVSRGGSMIFEIANWNIPSIIIPIPESISHDQTTNAFTYARSGAAVVIEEENLTPSVLLSEIVRLLDDKALLEQMKNSAKAFTNPEAAASIAREIIKIAIGHEE